VCLMYVCGNVSGLAMCVNLSMCAFLYMFICVACLCAWRVMCLVCVSSVSMSVCCVSFVCLCQVCV